jgi:hypothetical protein
MRIVLKPLGALIVLTALLGSVLIVFVQARRNNAGNPAMGATSAAPLPSKPTPAQNAATPTRNGVPPAQITVVNGSFTGGSKLPDGWTNLPWIGQGEARLERDTTEFKSAPASLRLEGFTETSYVALDHLLEGYKDGDTFHIKGWMKYEGTAKDAQLAIRGRAVEGATAPQKEYVYLTSVRLAKTWTPFNVPVTLKPGNKYAYFVMVVAGKGKLWVDDIEVGP